MGWCLFASLICMFLCFGTSICLQPNTDGFYVYDFLQKMGGEALTSVTIDTSSSVCSWKGISCGKGGQEHVIGFVASGVGLHGVIPDDTLGKLNSLQHLDLSGNDISGLSADFWGIGGSLKTLNLSSNKINGSLPSNIGNFGVLESLDLSNNRFDGDLPDAFRLLSSLRVLNLSSNKFYGRFPSGFLGCKSLVVIDLSANELNGSVPYDIGYAFRNLTALSLAGNRIRGRVPDFSGLESLTYLNLSVNFFQGPLKGVFHKRLQILDLSSNQFSGHISQVTSIFTSGSVDLAYLDLSENQLSGYFPSDLNNAWSLKHLNLASNRFSRSEFPRIDNLTNLEYLNLSKTRLTGNIPRVISDLHNLVVLVLSQNHLTGPIPELSTKDMKVLDLSWNNLTGEISKSLLNKLPIMLKFNFSHNNLTYCSTNISSETLHSAFYGSLNNCPVAVNPAAILEKKRTKHVSLKHVFAIVLSTFCLIVCLFCIALLCRKKTEQQAVKQRSFKNDQNLSGPFSFQTDSTTWVADVKVATSVPVVIFEKPLLNFTFEDLLSATSHFDRGTLLAEGRFGPVYRGFLPGGIHVAVKVLVNGSTLTDDEATRELEYLGQIKHLNLVPLIGYCIAGNQRFAIYEYMENGNLQHLLHDLPLGVQAVDDWCNDTWEDDNDDVQSITSEEQTTWRFRHKIALGSARAFAFLHYGCFPQIIHRDVKASSIFLDSSLEPRLSDFGLAKIVGSNLECELVRGSPGYTPPEFCGTETCEATSKSDVYGFGVVLFELLTGKKAVGDDYPEVKEANLVSWVRGLVRKNEISKAIDPKIWGTGSEKQMEEAVRIGYLCTADVPTKRPSMQQIVGLLKDIEPGITDQRLLT